MEKWFVAAKRADFNKWAKEFQISSVLARIIRNRDITDEEEVRKYLFGTLKDCYSPWLLHDMELAVDILIRKSKEQVPFRVIGDYDVDGICSSYILTKGLRCLGAMVDTVIPHRIHDGYGLNDQLIEDAKADGIQVLITCDNGIAAAPQIQRAIDYGMTVIVTDHHEVPFVEEDGLREEVLPPAHAIINPKQEKCNYPFPDICGGLVAYKLIQALAERVGQEAESVSVQNCEYNTTVYESNATFYESNATFYESNATVYGSNATIYESNATVCESNATVCESNAKVYESNATVCESNATVCESNTMIHEEHNRWTSVLKESLQFAALATVCDVMELVDENRIIVKEGLKVLRSAPNPGIRALMEVNALEPSKLSAYHLGFIIGPCLNATGRLDSALRALSLLECNNIVAAMTYAKELKELNDSRKNLTLQGQQEAEEYLTQNRMEQDKVLVIYLPEVHESLAGIIAGRIREKYNRPAIVLTKGEEGVKGSGRSIDAYHMFEALTEVKHFFVKYGGHKKAAGVSIHSIEEINAFREQLNRNCALVDEDFVPRIHIDVPMPLGFADMDLVRELELLEPFGVGNPKPLFAQKELHFVCGFKMGAKKNCARFRVITPEGGEHEIVFFGDLERFEQYLDGKYGIGSSKDLFTGKGSFLLSVAYQVGINAYRGEEKLQFIMQYYY